MKVVRFLLIVLPLVVFFPAKGQDFLDVHSGTYKGTLLLCYPTGVQDSLQFELLIQPTATPGRWTHTFRYLGENGSIGMVKDYELVKDSTSGDGMHYILDEKDGILIHEVRIGNTLYSSYTVDHQQYVVTTAFAGNYIDFELSCYDLPRMLESESEPDEENVTWKVMSFPLMTVQKGRLYKQ